MHSSGIWSHSPCHTDEYEGGLALYSYHESLFTGRRFLTPSGTILLSDGDDSVSPEFCQTSHRSNESVISSQAWFPVNSKKSQPMLLPPRLYYYWWRFGGQSWKVGETPVLCSGPQTAILGYWGRLMVVTTTFAPTSCIQAFDNALLHHCWHSHVS